MKKFFNRLPTVSFVLFVLGIGLFLWASYQFRSDARANTAFADVLEITDASALTAGELAESEGRPVLAGGPLTLRKAPADPMTGITAPDGLILCRTVEMCQYYILDDAVYRDFFSYQQQNISGRNGESYTNPVFPTEYVSTAFIGDASIGPLTIGPEIIGLIENENGFIDGELTRRDITDLPEPDAFPGMKLCADGYYTNGDPAAPEPGDIRIRYSYYPAAQFGSRLRFFGIQKNGALRADDTFGYEFVTDSTADINGLRKMLFGSGTDAAMGLCFIGVIFWVIAVGRFIHFNKRKREA